MDYMLMFYEPAGHFEQRRDRAASQPYWAAWMAYVQAMHAVGRRQERRRPAGAGDRNDGARRRRQAARPGRPVRRHQGAARRLLRHRRARSRHRARRGRRARRARPPAASRCGRCCRRRRKADDDGRATPPEDARRRRVARDSYGRLRRLPRRALARHRRRRGRARRRLRRGARHWPVDGVPDAPEAWLLTTARRRLHDRWRHGRVEAGAEETLRDRLRRARDGARAAVSRRAAEADVRLRASGDRSGGARGADAADRPRPRCGADRVGVPGRAGDAGAAARARQDQDPRRRHRLRGAATRTNGRRAWPTCSRRSTPPTAPAGTTSPAPTRERSGLADEALTLAAMLAPPRSRRRRGVGPARAARLLPVARRRRGATPPATTCRSRRRTRRAGTASCSASARRRCSGGRARRARRVPARGGDPVGAHPAPARRERSRRRRSSRSTTRSSRVQPTVGALVSRACAVGAARRRRRRAVPRSRRSPPPTCAATSRTGPRSPTSPPRAAMPRRRATRASAPSASAPTRRCVAFSCAATLHVALDGRPGTAHASILEADPLASIRRRHVPAPRHERQHADRRDVQLHGLRDARRGAQGRLRHRLLRGQGRAPVRRHHERARVAGRRDGAALSDPQREHRRPHPQGDAGPGRAREHASVRARAVGPLLGVRAQRRPEGLRAAPARRRSARSARPTASAPSAG